MDGIEATKQLRELGYKAPIVALTANAVLGRKDLFMSSGFDEFVAKPIDIRELNLILHKYVHEKKSRRAADMSSADEQQLATAPFLDSIDEEFDSDIDENFNVKIEGLDVEKGIERYGGDKKTYITLLRSYASSVSNILRTIEAGASKDNISIYETSVHGIKGASWDIFADEVGTAAKELEFAAKADDLGFIEKNHAPFVELANKLISEIQLTLEILDTENPKQKKIKPEEEILEKLLTACKTYNMDDVDAAIDEIEEYEYTDDDGLAQWLREKIDRSDFRQIVERLSQNT
jgi:CheY-like chemotaxis protein